MKTFLTVGFFFIVFQPISYSQDQHLADSLRHELAKTKSTRQEMSGYVPAFYDTLAANLLFQLSKVYLSNVPDSAMYYAEQSLLLAESVGYKKGMARAYNIMGAIENRRGNYLEAMNLYKQNLRLRKEMDDKKGIASCYNNIGVIYDDMGKYPEALQNYLASLKILEEIGDKEGAADCYNNIGVIYDFYGNVPMALKNYAISLKLREELDDKDGIAGSYINLGVIYKGQGHYQEAMKHYLLALKAYQELGDSSGIATCYNNIGNINYRMGDIPEALKSYSTALKIKSQLEDKKGIAEAENNLGVTYIQIRDFAKASFHLNKALAISKEISHLDLIKNSYLGLAELDSARGDFGNSLSNFKQYIQIRDSLVNNENTRKIALQQMQFDFDKKQEADKLKFNQEKEISAIKLQKQKAYTRGGMAGITVALVLLFFVYRNYKKHRIAHKELKETQAQLVKSEKMAAFGVMASRVSHEIQNPLNFVNNFSDLSQEMVKDVIEASNADEKRQYSELLIANLRKINEHGKRASTIISQLQEHSMKGTSHEFFEKEQA